MNRRRTALLAVLALVASSCGGGDGKSTTGRGASPDDDLAGVVSEVESVIAEPEAGDAVYDSLVEDLGLRDALGDRADEILTLAREGRSAAIDKLTAATLTGGPGRSRAGAARPARALAAGGGSAMLMVLTWQQSMRLGLDPWTSGRGHPSKDDSTTRTERRDSPGATITVTLDAKTKVAVNGSRPALTLHWVIHTVVTDKATGKTLLDMTEDDTYGGEIDVCPNTAGAVPALVDLDFRATSTASSGAAGRAGVRSTASVSGALALEGHVDDQAALGSLSADTVMRSEWDAGAAAGSGAGGDRTGMAALVADGFVMPAEGGALDAGAMDGSKVTGSTEWSGDGSYEKASKLGGVFGTSFAMIVPVFEEAQRLWRHGRCVVVVAPDYDAETPVRIEEQDAVQHTEDVEPASATQFAVKLRHRFGGGLAAPLVDELISGGDDLAPARLDSLPGSLTYTAPGEEDKTADARLTSTSRRGIGTLVLRFRTSPDDLRIDGKWYGLHWKATKCDGAVGEWDLAITSTGYLPTQGSFELDREPRPGDPPVETSTGLIAFHTADGLGYDESFQLTFYGDGADTGWGAPAGSPALGIDEAFAAASGQQRGGLPVQTGSFCDD